jgi:uncharacterized protein DUF4157
MISAAVAHPDRTQAREGSPSAPKTRVPERAPPGRLRRPSAVPVRRPLEIGGGNSGAEREADRLARASSPTPNANGATPMPAPRIVDDVLRRESGAPLDDASRELFEPRFRHDFSAVRVHTGRAASASARAIQAEAYAAGDHIVLAEGPGASRELLAHELAHVVQDRERGEARAVQRRVEIRDVGRGEQSGFARVPELIKRLNGVADGLVFTLDAKNDLQYTENPYGTMTEFEKRMKGFIDSGTPIRLRITNQSGLLKDDKGKFTLHVDLDAFQSGYVDIDDLLADDDLTMQTDLVHFLTERSVTKDYTRRIGTNFSQKEFDFGHAQGIDAETHVLRDFFKDDTIRFVSESDSAGIARLWTNSRRDEIRSRFKDKGGLESGFIDVKLRDGRVISATEYRDLLAAAKAPAAGGAGGAP